MARKSLRSTECRASTFSNSLVVGSGSTYFVSMWTNAAPVGGYRIRYNTYDIYI